MKTIELLKLITSFLIYVLLFILSLPLILMILFIGWVVDKLESSQVSS